jgi:hypothetical protein
MFLLSYSHSFNVLFFVLTYAHLGTYFIFFLYIFCFLLVTSLACTTPIHYTLLYYNK